ncbi:hypothetical protein ElyMa_004793700 [Elysia marginata]|uniref:Uncharacterized protein n=1 Tax=Elysia marginata TaxID=1093978 RepID=A0AAV4IED5_9GAST|nr:hypothetical protein ElyMa_004793700 [Elysia marginata]
MRCNSCRSASSEGCLRRNSCVEKQRLILLSQANNFSRGLPHREGAKISGNRILILQWAEFASGSIRLIGLISPKRFDVRRPQGASCLGSAAVLADWVIDCHLLPLVAPVGRVNRLKEFDLVRQIISDHYEG